MLKLANHPGNYADYLRIADYIGFLKFRQVSAEYTGNRDKFCRFDLPKEEIEMDCNPYKKASAGGA